MLDFLNGRNPQQGRDPAKNEIQLLETRRYKKIELRSQRRKAIAFSPCSIGLLRSLPTLKEYKALKFYTLFCMRNHVIIMNTFTFQMTFSTVHIFLASHSFGHYASLINCCSFWGSELGVCFLKKSGPV